MDENVVFNPPPQDGSAGSPPGGSVPPGDQQNPPETGTPDEQTPTDASGEVTDQTTNETATEDGTEGTEEGASDETPPPGGIAGFLANGLIKKVLIGVGAVILLIFIIILLLPKGQPDKPVTLTWWGLWEDASTMQPLIQDFQKTHPNVTVQYVKNDPSQYLDRLQARFQSGNGPDIFLYHNTWLPMLSSNLSPLSTDVITPDQFKQTYYPVMQQDLTQNGAIYGIPMEADTLALFVNPSIFEDAGVSVPSNWDDFVKAAKQLTVKDKTTGKIKTAGAALGTYDNINHAPDIISLLFLQQGVQMNNITASAANESGALQFYTGFAAPPDNVWDGTLDNSLLAFSKGNLAMYFGFSWDVFQIQQLNPNLNFKIYPVPKLVGGKNITIASYWVNGVSSKSPNQKAAMEFMNYLAQKSTAQQFYTQTAKVRSFGEPYARKDLQDSLRENQMIYPFVSQLDNAGSSYFASNTDDGDTGLNSQMNTYLQTAVGAVLDQSNSADSAVETLNNGIVQVLQKYGQGGQQ